MAKNDPNGRTALYRLLAANGRLLYVGIASNPDSRWGQHSTNQQWWNDVADRKTEWFPTRAAAAAAEVAAIKTERPMHNIQHAVVDKPVIPAQAASYDDDVPPPDEEWPPPPSQSPGDRLPFKRSFTQPPIELVDVGSEQSLLGCMLRSKRAIRDALCITTSADLTVPGHRAIWLAIVDLDRQDEPADPITVASELAKRGEIVSVGGPSYLHVLRNCVVSSAVAGHHAAIVHTLAITRRWAEAQAKLKR